MLNQSRLIDVIQFIIETEPSIEYHPSRFISSIKDLYTGDIEQRDDFIYLIKFLSQYISTDSLRLKNVQESVYSNSKKTIFIKIFKSIYIDKKISELSNYQPNFEEAYVHKTFKNEVLNDGTKASIIKKFTVNYNENIEYGSIIDLEWECTNPYVVVLKAGNTEMDVSQLNSLKLSAIFEDYILILYDISNQIVDKKIAYIKYKESAFCINCGEHIFSIDDKYCINCGTKVGIV